MIKRKYFIERKYLRAAIFFAAAGIVTAGVFSLPDDEQDEMTVTDRLEQCQKVMRANDSDRMEREKEHCLKEYQRLFSVRD